MARMSPQLQEAHAANSARSLEGGSAPALTLLPQNKIHLKHLPPGLLLGVGPSGAGTLDPAAQVGHHYYSIT